jgi:hypothetical protein
VRHQLRREPAKSTMSASEAGIVNARAFSEGERDMIIHFTPNATGNPPGKLDILRQLQEHEREHHDTAARWRRQIHEIATRERG